MMTSREVLEIFQGLQEELGHVEPLSAGEVATPEQLELVREHLLLCRAYINGVITSLEKRARHD